MPKQLRALKAFVSGWKLHHLLPVLSAQQPVFHDPDVSSLQDYRHVRCHPAAGAGALEAVWHFLRGPREHACVSAVLWGWKGKQPSFQRNLPVVSHVCTLRSLLLSLLDKEWLIDARLLER